MSFFCSDFVDDEGIKDDKQMIVYWVISGHFIPQNRRGSGFTGSRYDLNVPIKIVSVNGIFVKGFKSRQNNKYN